MTVPIWKFWDPERADEPKKKVDTKDKLLQQRLGNRQRNIKQQESQPK